MDNDEALDTNKRGPQVVMSAVFLYYSAGNPSPFETSAFKSDFSRTTG